MPRKKKTRRSGRKKRLRQNPFPALQFAALSVINQVKGARAAKINRLKRDMKPKVDQLTDDILGHCEVSNKEKQLLQQTLKSAVYQQFEHKLRSVSNTENLELKNLDDILDESKIVHSLPTVIQGLIRDHHRLDQLKHSYHAATQLYQYVINYKGDEQATDYHNKIEQLLAVSQNALELYRQLPKSLQNQALKEYPKLLKDYKRFSALATMLIS